MTQDVHTIVTSDQAPQIIALFRSLPAILAGKLPDTHGIAAGFKARIGYAMYSLIAPNFNDLGRGIAGADGDKWAYLSKEYLAYSRRFGDGEKTQLKKDAGVSQSGKYGVGGKGGLLTPDQVKLWRKTFARTLAQLIMKMPDSKAKARAAAVAWIVVKKAGGRTKIETYGSRKVQMLVDTGYLRGSLQPGTLIEDGPSAVYVQPPGKGGLAQIYRTEPSRVVLGSRDFKAKYHHLGRGRRRRRLWPERFPQAWWDQILGVAVSGLQRIHELVQAGGKL